MSDYAHDLSPTSPGQQFDPISIQQPGPPAPLLCMLCSTVLAGAAERCPSCGLWMGGHGKTVSRPTLYRVAAVFGAVYALALVIVLIAR